LWKLALSRVWRRTFTIKKGDPITAATMPARNKKKIKKGRERRASEKERKQGERKKRPEEEAATILRKKVKDSDWFCAVTPSRGFSVSYRPSRRPFIAVEGRGEGRKREEKGGKMRSEGGKRGKEREDKRAKAYRFDRGGRDPNPFECPKFPPVQKE
jgi:hypothetical protein